MTKRKQRRLSDYEEYMEQVRVLENVQTRVRKARRPKRKVKAKSTLHF